MHTGVAQSYVSGAMAKGTSMHTSYSVPYKSFDRRVLRYRLFRRYGRVLSRRIKRSDAVIELRGIPDDYRVLSVKRSKVVSVIEVKTTSKKRLWVHEKAIAAFQLQLYVWLLEPLLASIGYKLHVRHWLEMYRQQDGSLIERVPVYAIEDTERVMLRVVDAFNGLVPMTIPKAYVCKRCPKNIKEVCDWRQMR